jgi:hypothetical protein
MNRRTRNRLCIWIIIVGLLNFAAYTVVYFRVGGDARNGSIDRDADGSVVYRLGGGDVFGAQRPSREVSAGVWVYSYLHSISIWISQAAVLVSMLLLARPHIIATMKGTWMSGGTFVTVASTLVIFVTGLNVVMFAWNFVEQLLTT